MRDTNINTYFGKIGCWKDITDEEFEEMLPGLVESLLKVPYTYNYTPFQLQEDWYQLLRFGQFDDFSASQISPGLKVCKHFFPNFFDINSYGKKFSDFWNEKELTKVLKWCKKGMPAPYLSWIRKAIYFTAGLTSSTMYRPHLAKTVILATNKGGGTVFDPCAGWGGRLLGTVSAGWYYIGLEPNRVTYDNLVRMVESLGIQRYVKIYNDVAENMHEYCEKADMVITSPPYYDLETYSDWFSGYISQYKTYDEWSDKWLKNLVFSCLDIVGDKGYSCWNVQNMPSKGMHMFDDVDKYHKERGFTVKSEFGITSPVENIRKAVGKRSPDTTKMYTKENKPS